MIRVQRDESHEHSIASHASSKFIRDTNGGNRTPSGSFLIWKHFPIETPLSLAFGGSGVDLLPRHFVDLLHFVKEGIEVCRFQLLQLLLERGKFEIALNEFVLSRTRFSLYGQGVFSADSSRISWRRSSRTIY